MTTLVTLYLRDAIIMSADTLLRVVDNYEDGNIIGTEQIQKLFLVDPPGIGISAIGFSAWGGKSIVTIIAEYLELLGDAMSSPRAFARGFARYLTNAYPLLQTDFHVCGYDRQRPFVFELERQPDSMWTVTQKNKGMYNILAMCEPATIAFVGSNPPDFDNLTVPDALTFLSRLYRFELNVVSKKPLPDTGEPIDVLILRPGQHEALQLKELMTNP